MRLRKTAVVITAMLLILFMCSGALAVVGTGWDDDCRGHITESGSGGHDWVLQSSVPGKTCTSTGVGTYRCSYCGATIRHETSAPGHEWGEWKAVKEATCAEGGEEIRTCKKCGETEKRKTDRAPHSWSEWTVDPDSTGPAAELAAAGSGDPNDWKTEEGELCFRQVTESRVCGVCGESRSRTSGKTVHTWGEWTVTLEATDFSAGVRQHVCRVCGAEESEEFDPDPTYRPGDSGSGVKELQEGLNALGYDCGKADGTFGTKTEKAVKAIEKDHGVTADGIAWPGVQQWIRIPISAYSSGESAQDFLSGLRGTEITTFSGNLPFMITKQPEGGVFEPDGSLTLTVGASGGKKPYTYEWHRYSPAVGSQAFFALPSYIKGVLIDQVVSTEGPEYTAGDIMSAELIYYCIVRDSGDGEKTSESVRVGPRLYISEQPRNASILGKESVTLSCGSGVKSRPVSYAWYMNGVSMDNSPDRKTVTVTAPGEYFCEVSDGTDTVRSDSAFVYDAPEPWVRSAEAPAYLRPGMTTANISVTFQGGVPPLTCEWYLDGELKAGYQSYSVAETESEFTASDLGTYDFIVTDSLGNKASGTAWTEYDQLEIVKQPEGGVLPKLGPYILSTEVGEEAVAPLTYTLFRDGEPVKKQKDISSFNVYQPGVYYIRITDHFERWAETAEATLTEDVSGLRIGKQTKQAVISDSSPVKDGKPGTNLYVTAEGGTPPYRYFWYLRGQETRLGKNSSYFATKPGTYLCRVEDQKENTVLTNEIPVAYRAGKPVIMTQPRDVRLAKGAKAGLVCTARSGTGNNSGLIYIWQIRNNSGWKTVQWGKQKLTTKKDGLYRCVVIDKKTGRTTISRIARVVYRLQIVKLSQTRISNEKIRLDLKWRGGTKPYAVRIYRREMYQVYLNGKWVTRYRNRLMENKKVKAESLLHFTLPKRYSTIIQGQRMNRKAGYIVLITDGSGQKIQRLIEAK